MACIHSPNIKSLACTPVAVEGKGVHRCIKKDMNANAIIKLLDHTQKIALASFSLKWNAYRQLSCLPKLFWTFTHISRCLAGFGQNNSGPAHRGHSGTEQTHSRTDSCHNVSRPRRTLLVSGLSDLSFTELYISFWKCTTFPALWWEASKGIKWEKP